jgi:2-polyprenyl-6-methoxyphenol hydroxylase-like FAD-dependent oxidoreductase
MYGEFRFIEFRFSIRRKEMSEQGTGAPWADQARDKVAAEARPARAGGEIQTDVLIIGAGPTGLVLGCELARRGIRFLIADKDARPFTGSRGKGLQPRTQEILEDLGVLAEVRAHGGLYPPIRASQDGAVLFEGRMDPLSEPTPDVPYPNVWMLPQWRTGEILRARLAGLGGAVTFGTELESLRQDDDGVSAVLRHDSGEYVARTRYVVGADGGHSAVRRALGVGFLGETREEQRMIVADVRADGIGRDHWQVWTAAGPGPGEFLLALCPLAGTDTFQLTAPLAPGEPVPELTIAGLQAVVDGAAGQGLITLTDVSWASVYRANIRMAEQFAAGRVFLAGDAAHVHSPAGGQGLNTGIQDAYNLGWKLAAVLAGAPARLLDSYAAERLPVAARVLGISTELHDKAAGGEPDAHLRDNPELRQLNLGYRDSALSCERRAAPGSVRAGDRAPDAPGRDLTGRPARLFDLIHGGRITLLAFGPAAERVAADLTAAGPAAADAVRIVAVRDDLGPADVPALLDTDGHARRGYGIPAGADVLLVIRPDGYLGLAADASPAVAGPVAEYLAGLGAVVPAPVAPGAASSTR